MSNEKNDMIIERLKYIFEVVITVIILIISFFLNRTFNELDDTVEELQTLIISTNTQQEIIKTNQKQIENCINKIDDVINTLNKHNEKIAVLENKIKYRSVK